MTLILHIKASPRKESVSTQLAEQLIEKLKTTHAGAQVKVIDTETLPYVTEDMINAFYTPAETRTAEQSKLVAQSDALVADLFAAGAVVISTPMWNFTIPASLKSWIDLIVRVGLTFKFNPEGGFTSLIPDRKTYVVAATGGVPLGAPYDLLSPVLKTALGFVGIQSVEFIAAEGTNMPNAAEVIAGAKKKIETLAA
jgi:FMN-dependent NADH-azoreductase